MRDDLNCFISRCVRILATNRYLIEQRTDCDSRNVEALMQRKLHVTIREIRFNIYFNKHTKKIIEISYCCKKYNQER